MGKVQERLAWWRPRRVCDAATADGAGHRLLDVSSWSVQTGDKSWGPTNIETQARRLDKASPGIQEGTGQSRAVGPSGIQRSGRRGWSDHCDPGPSGKRTVLGSPAPASRRISLSPGAPVGSHPLTTALCPGPTRGLCTVSGARMQGV